MGIATCTKAVSGLGFYINLIYNRLFFYVITHLICIFHYYSRSVKIQQHFY